MTAQDIMNLKKEAIKRLYKGAKVEILNRNQYKVTEQVGYKKVITKLRYTDDGKLCDMKEPETIWYHSYK